MDTGIWVILFFVIGLLSFLVYLKTSDVKQDGGSIFDSILDLLFIAWIFNHDHKE